MPITKKPLCVDLYAGLGGWAEGFLAEGYRVQGYDIEKHDYGTGTYPGELFIRDVRSLHGSQFADAACIVASPPCTEYSYMAMPWSRAKQIASALRGKGEFPDGYTGSRTIQELTALFDACFRIQREASEAAGRHIPMIVENVRGACPWVGRSVWNYGSFHLWGDVPALMPITGPVRKGTGGTWFTLENSPDTRGLKVSEFRFDGSGESFQTASVKAISGQKTPPGNCSAVLWKDREIARYSHPTPEEMEKQGFGVKSEGHKVEYADRDSEGTKQHGSGPIWFDTGIAAMSSKGQKRKAASAEIAKIPLPLALHIARMFLRS